MHQGALRALEFDRIVEAVCRHAQTPPGREKLARLEPHTDPGAVAAALAATAETARFLGENAIGFQAPDDLDAILTALAVEGRAIEPIQLLALATFLSSIDAVIGSIRRARASFSILRGIADGGKLEALELRLDGAGELVCSR